MNKDKDQVLESIESNLKQVEKILFYEPDMQKKTEALYFINMAILDCKVWRDGSVQTLPKNIS